jgi:hypothetical protein
MVDVGVVNVTVCLSVEEVVVRGGSRCLTGSYYRGSWERTLITLWPAVWWHVT